MAIATLLFTRRRLLGSAAAAATTLALVSLAALAAPRPRAIKVVAKKFEFVPGEIHVRLGEPVLLLFTAPEVPMGFSLPDFRLRTDIMPGQTARLALTADRVGSFTFLCDVFCGKGHEEMSGTLVVS